MSGSHTNVSIPNDGDVRRRLEVEKLTLEVDFWRDRFDALAREMDNIPRAISEWGYCDLRDHDGNVLRIVAQADPPK